MLNNASSSAASLLSASKPQASIDGTNLNDLKRLAREDPRAAVKSAAKQFEAVFMQMLLKSMRDTEMKSGMLDSSSTEMYNSMFDSQLTQNLSKGKGLGLADMLEKQMLRQMDAIKPGQAKANDQTLPFLQPNQSTLDRIRKASQEAKQVMEGDAPSTTAPKQFVQKLWTDAKSAEHVSGIPAQFMLGQAALESGWGKREIKMADGSTSHNLFGIKAGGNWQGKVAESVTTEYVNGVAKKSVERFRAYDSYAEAFQDYAKLVGNNPRYAGVMRSINQGADPQSFAASLQRAGYATDPNYADKLGKTIATTLRVVA